MGRGGSRPGAGRPKKDRIKQDFFEDAEAYLLGVVQGITPPDAARIQAAKALIAYQTPKKRPRAKSPTPSQLRKREALSMERGQVEDFETKAAEIRANLKRKER